MGWQQTCHNLLSALFNVTVRDSNQWGVFILGQCSVSQLVCRHAHFWFLDFKIQTFIEISFAIYIARHKIQLSNQFYCFIYLLVVMESGLVFFLSAVNPLHTKESTLLHFAIVSPVRTAVGQNGNHDRHLLLWHVHYAVGADFSWRR